ncbi:MAG: hypothetical protein AAF212_13420, partial [Verrucomicrobiota bacterium]
TSIPFFSENASPSPRINSSKLEAACIHKIASSSRIFREEHPLTSKQRDKTTDIPMPCFEDVWLGLLAGDILNTLPTLALKLKGVWIELMAKSGSQNR